MKVILLASLVALAHVDSARAQTAATYRVISGLSQASYAVDEVFFNENNRLFTAVGVTPAVSGSLLLDINRPGDARLLELVVDLRPLRSDSERRDRAVRFKYLDTNRFPYARLSSAALRGMPRAITHGRVFRYSLSGDLEVHGVTKRTTWQGEATISGDTLRGVARSTVKMSAFGIEVPSLLTLRSADDVKLEIRFVAVMDRNRELR